MWKEKKVFCWLEKLIYHIGTQVHFECFCFLALNWLRNFKPSSSFEPLSHSGEDFIVKINKVFVLNCNFSDDWRKGSHSNDQIKLSF